MKDQGSQKGKSRKPVSSDTTSPALPDGKGSGSKITGLTSKEKIAANQKNKRRK
jgi:hypothetical protein